MFKWRGWLARDELNNEGERLDVLMMCGRGAQQPGVRERAGPALADVDELEVEQPRRGSVANECERRGGTRELSSYPCVTG